jgi:hypothetical protein
MTTIIFYPQIKSKTDSLNWPQVVVLVLIGKYKNRHKGEYLTREDEGAHDAFDADTAVLQGRTGHQVEKKKEWFI